jgi:prepilin-type N-terminal cleavage/methylation domain-containing protein
LRISHPRGETSFFFGFADHYADLARSKITRRNFANEFTSWRSIKRRIATARKSERRATARNETHATGEGDDMKRNQGFTLIELMTAISISAMLGLLAVPMTMNWMRGSRQMQAQSDVVAAIAHARALSLRNAEGLPSGAKAASVKLSSGVLEVRDGKDAVVWTAQLPASVKLKYSDGSDFVCVAYDSRGTLVESGSCKFLLSPMIVSTSGQGDLNAPLL